MVGATGFEPVTT